MAFELAAFNRTMSFDKSQVNADKTVELILRDVNYQDIQKLIVTTNEFGSFSGTFILPNNGLTGHYEISVQAQKSFRDKLPFSGNNQIYGSVGFSVEEYKRPKFSASFNKVKETFKLNDSLIVKGVATAYAGSAISDAKVVYRVKRQVRYPKWWYWYRPYWNQSEAQEISHGEVVTNEKGEFEISFLAQPDKSISAKDLPTFHYKITADITDINGETRSTSTVVNVGYHTLIASIGIDAKIDKESKENKLTIDTKNLNGEFVPAKGVLKIYKVASSNKVYRKRPWSAPDYQVISKVEFEKQFPHDVYANNKSSEFETGKLIFEKAFNTEKDKEVALKNIKKWDSGKYIAVVESTDKFEQKITDRVQFEVFSDSDDKVADKQLFTIKFDKDEYKPNDKIKLRIGSASNDMSVIIDVEKNHKVIRTEVLQLNDELKTISIPVNKEDLGGFGISYYFVNYNSFESGKVLVSVPYPKTELEIETLTFRNKLQPGQEETWSFKIKGPKGDKVVAEILTSMYDASLDQFKMHQWSFQPIYNKFYRTVTTSRASNSFRNSNFRVFQKPFKYTSVSHQNYDALNWFGFSFGRSYYDNIMPVSMEMEEVTVTTKGRPRRGIVQLAKAKGDLTSAPMGESMDGATYANGAIVNDKDEIGESSQEEVTDFSNVKIRTDFKETAFFFPHLTTDKKGNVSFEFTTPESLTKWKLQLLAHTKDLNSALKTLETVTQKELLVLPNPPRFLREGDEIVFSSKISNLTEKQLQGVAELQLFDAITNESIDIALGNDHKIQSFSVDSKGNTNLQWILKIPFNVQAVQYKIIAKAGDYSDGEQNVLPVLSNRMLVTETLPMWVRSNQTKTFTLD